MMRALMNHKNAAATAPPNTGEITQLAAILVIVGQFTAAKPAAAMPAPITPPTTEWVVDTGAPTHVARFTQRAADKSAASIAQINTWAVGRLSGAMMPLAMVLTTSPPAISAPALSNTTAIAIALPIDRAPAPTAGPMLLATSLAPMFSAM